MRITSGVAPRVMERLEEKLGPENIHHTDEQGTVEFTIEGEK